MAISPKEGPKIAIIGAGPAGLTLARILLQNGVTDLTILELEQSRQARAQGGSLDLHPRTGQAALKEAGLFEEFERLCRYDDEDLTIVDNTNKVHIAIKDEETGRPEIDRVQLRGMLLDSIPEELIRWGAKVKEIHIATITLATGEKLTGFDLIVGADGAWSKVRSLLTSVKPFYSGIGGYGLRLHDISTRHPGVAAMLGRGSYFALGDGRCLLIQRQGTADVKILAAMHKPENWVSEKWSVDVDATEQVKALLLEEYSEFAPELRNLVDIAEDDFQYYPLYQLPVGLQWRHKAGATLIGDAAHLMTPFAGEGVNNAMADALSLAKAIINAKSGELDAAVKSYENEMYERVEPSAARTWRNLQNRFFKAEPAKIMAKMLRKAELAAAKGEGATKKS